MKTKIFCENPYDIETIFEGIEISRRTGQELIYMDRLVATLRLDPMGDLTNINFKILSDMNLIAVNYGKKNEKL